MTFLDQTILEGHRRCQQYEINRSGNKVDDRPVKHYRQCILDDGHLGRCEFGVWNLMPQSMTGDEA